MRRGTVEGNVRDSTTVSSVEEEGAVGLPEPLLEQPKDAPPLSELTAESLALVLDGPSLVSPFCKKRFKYASCEFDQFKSRYSYFQAAEYNQIPELQYTAPLVHLQRAVSLHVRLCRVLLWLFDDSQQHRLAITAVP